MVVFCSSIYPSVAKDKSRAIKNEKIHQLAQLYQVAQHVPPKYTDNSPHVSASRPTSMHAIDPTTRFTLSSRKEKKIPPRAAELNMVPATSGPEPESWDGHTQVHGNSVVVLRYAKIRPWYFGIFAGKTNGLFARPIYVYEIMKFFFLCLLKPKHRSEVSVVRGPSPDG